MHVQGDAAAEQALRAIEAAVRKHGMRDHRPVFIHATYMRPDQIRRMKAVGGVPTYLTGSIPKLGEIVIHLWGPERAHASVATRTLLNAGMPFTFSHDAPVSPSPSVLVLVDAGVNRIMPNGSLIGGDERISPYDALRAVSGSDIWIIDALRWTRHPTHAHVDQALEWVAAANVGKAVLTNLHIDLDYKALAALVPSHVEIAHDGWTAAIRF
jgi:predicted amidohydrolase YtcJ